jgi:hypothetical protein
LVASTSSGFPARRRANLEPILREGKVFSIRPPVGEPDEVHRIADFEAETQTKPATERESVPHCARFSSRPRRSSIFDFLIQSQRTFHPAIDKKPRRPAVSGWPSTNSVAGARYVTRRIVKVAFWAFLSHFAFGCFTDSSYQLRLNAFEEASGSSR